MTHLGAGAGDNVQGVSGDLRIRGDKTINISYLVRVTIWCPLEFSKYPHDTQVNLFCIEHEKLDLNVFEV